MRRYHLKYKRLDQLLDEVRLDFEAFDSSNLIKTHQAIKVAKRVNKELGLKLNKTKQIVLEISNGRARLPEDFYIANFLFLMDKYTVSTSNFGGTTTIDLYEEDTPYHVAPPEVVNTCDPCKQCGEELIECKPCSRCTLKEISCNLDTCGNEYKVYQVTNRETREFNRLMKLSIVNNNWVSDRCFNLGTKSINKAWIEDGWIYFNIDKGYVYINYEGMMEDDDGHLMVLDHDIINEYYEYAIKKRILENMAMNNENVTQLQLQLIMEGLRASKANAYSVVRTPDFEEMKQVWYQNRNAMYAKYYSQFSTKELF